MLPAITAGVSGVLLYAFTNALGPDSVCGGAASADAVHDALGPGRISEEKSAGYAPAAVDPARYCRAAVSSGLFGDTGRSVSFGLSVSRSAGAEARPAARLFAEGGAVGAVTPGGARALLPEGCPAGLRATVGAGHDGEDGDHAEGIARLAVGLAGLAAGTTPCCPSPGPCGRSSSQPPDGRSAASRSSPSGPLLPEDRRLPRRIPPAGEADRTAAGRTGGRVRGSVGA
ncbi:hypothetical protein ACFVFS_31395 [Kitasatospora sp. NPDC057692]|uniref:hypothetical protein n=1 Tax=Kitasatospora sp. NPDC057692 TaxID=3346215 RepID=UPI0036AAF5FC